MIFLDDRDLYLTTSQFLYEFKLDKDDVIYIFEDLEENLKVPVTIVVRKNYLFPKVKVLHLTFEIKDHSVDVLIKIEESKSKLVDLGFRFVYESLEPKDDLLICKLIMVKD